MRQERAISSEASAAVAEPSARPGTAGALLSALLHQASGGLNNASLSLELAMLPSGASPSSAPATLRMGLGGVQQVARALLMLREVVEPGSTCTWQTAIPMQDVLALVRAHAAGRRVEIHAPPDSLLASACTNAETAVSCAGAAIDAIDALPAGAGLKLGLHRDASGTSLVPLGSAHVIGLPVRSGVSP